MVHVKTDIIHRFLFFPFFIIDLILHSHHSSPSQPSSHSSCINGSQRNLIEMLPKLISFSVSRDVPRMFPSRTNSSNTLFRTYIMYLLLFSALLNKIRKVMQSMLYTVRYFLFLKIRLRIEKWVDFHVRRLDKMFTF